MLDGCTLSTSTSLVPHHWILDHRSSLSSKPIAIKLAKDSRRCSLSDRRNTTVLDKKKFKYIKGVMHSRVPHMSEAEFESLWALCRASVSKSYQGFGNKSLGYKCDII